MNREQAILDRQLQAQLLANSPDAAIRARSAVFVWKVIAVAGWLTAIAVTCLK